MVLPGVPRAPLVPLPVVRMPVERIAMDLVGLLTKSTVEFRYILVIMDCATCFLEAIPLKSATAWTITAELMKIFARVGLL